MRTQLTVRAENFRSQQFAKIALAAAIALALTFTLSCSDDKDEGGGAACKYTTIVKGNSIEICEEFSKEYLEKHSVGDVKKECQAETERNGSTFYDSCPSGYILKCKDEEEIYYHNWLTIYLYGNGLENTDCDKHFRDRD